MMRRTAAAPARNVSQPVGGTPPPSAQGSQPFNLVSSQRFQAPGVPRLKPGLRLDGFQDSPLFTQTARTAAKVLWHSGHVRIWWRSRALSSVPVSSRKTRAAESPRLQPFLHLADSPPIRPAAPLTRSSFYYRALDPWFPFSAGWALLSRRKVHFFPEIADPPVKQVADLDLIHGKAHRSLRWTSRPSTTAGRFSCPPQPFHQRPDCRFHLLPFQLRLGSLAGPIGRKHLSERVQVRRALATLSSEPASSSSSTHR